MEKNLDLEVLRILAGKNPSIDDSLHCLQFKLLNCNEQQVKSHLEKMMDRGLIYGKKTSDIVSPYIFGMTWQGQNLWEKHRPTTSTSLNMERNWGMVRKILQFLSDNNPSKYDEIYALDDADGEIVKYHLKMMIDEGFIDGDTTTKPYYRINGITEQGRNL